VSTISFFAIWLTYGTKNGPAVGDVASCVILSRRCRFLLIKSRWVLPITGCRAGRCACGDRQSTFGGGAGGFGRCCWGASSGAVQRGRGRSARLTIGFALWVYNDLFANLRRGMRCPRYLSGRLFELCKWLRPGLIWDQ